MVLNHRETVVVYRLLLFLPIVTADRIKNISGISDKNNFSPLIDGINSAVSY